MVAGFAAFKNHLSYLPFSGSVLRRLTEELRGAAPWRRALCISGRSLPAEDTRHEARSRAAVRDPAPAV